jgi:hypothetical protein
MVDQRYWHRNAEGKQVLGDELVRLLLRTREQRADDFKQRLHDLAEEEFDTWPRSDRSNGHLYLLAEPAADRVPIPLDQAGTDQLEAEELWAQVLGRHPLHRPPTLKNAQSRVPHPDGILLSAWDRTLEPSLTEDDMVRVLMRNDGALAVVTGAGAIATPDPDRLAAPARTIDLGQQVGPFVYTCCALLSHLAEKYLAYNGEWRIGVRIDKTHRALPIHHGLSIFRGFQTAEYLHVESTTTDELTAEPGAVRSRLFDRLGRGLGLGDVRYHHVPLP